MSSTSTIPIEKFARRIGIPSCPAAIAVCASEDFGADPRLIPTSLRGGQLQSWRRAEEPGAESANVASRQGRIAAMARVALPATTDLIHCRKSSLGWLGRCGDGCNCTFSDKLSRNSPSWTAIACEISVSRGRMPCAKLQNRSGDSSSRHGAPMLAGYMAFATVAALVVISPGPATFLLLKNTPVQGRRAGLLNVVGIVAAVLSHAALSLLGLSAIILASPAAFQLVKLTAAAYLAYLGFKACREAWRGIDFSTPLDPDAVRERVSTTGALAEGWFTNILNPKPSMFYLSVFPQFLDPSGNLLMQGSILAGLHAGISAAWFSFVVLCIDRIRVLLRNPILWRGIKGLTGLVLTGLAARLATLSAPG